MTTVQEVFRQFFPKYLDKYSPSWTQIKAAN
ncbi:hypothetical protein J2S19_004504, partial [Metabacillus malikii]|nr:hypothetical protein [Metabacillus malikii]